MRWYSLRYLTALCVIALVTTGIDCGDETPEEKIATARSQYTVTLLSVTEGDSDPEPAIDKIAEEGVALSADAAATGGEEAMEITEGEEGELEELDDIGPRTANVLFDLLVRFSGKEALNGITVDVTHADANDDEKGVYRQYIDTAGMVNGEERQIDFEIDDMSVEDGDGFAVTLSSGVPADLSQYREFSEPAP